jgi:hypothetical protein
MQRNRSGAGSIMAPLAAIPFSMDFQSIPGSSPILTLYLGNFFDTQTWREPE